METGKLLLIIFRFTFFYWKRIRVQVDEDEDLILHYFCSVIQADNEKKRWNSTLSEKNSLPLISIKTTEKFQEQMMTWNYKVFFSHHQQNSNFLHHFFCGRASSQTLSESESRHHFNPLISFVNIFLLTQHADEVEFFHPARVCKHYLISVAFLCLIPSSHLCTRDSIRILSWCFSVEINSQLASAARTTTYSISQTLLREMKIENSKNSSNSKASEVDLEERILKLFKWELQSRILITFWLKIHKSQTSHLKHTHKHQHDRALKK